MLEVYLFVNPLGDHCMRAEQTILQLASETEKQIQFQFVPLLNIQVIQRVMRCQGSNLNDWNTQNQETKLVYRLILDYKAALFQGKKRGRNFLIHMQQALINQHQVYDDAMVKKVAADINLDIEMFMEDRESPLAKQAFKADQRLASEMNITEPSSAVIFDCDRYDYGVLLEDFDHDTLNSIVNGQLDPFADVNTNQRSQHQMPGYNGAQLRIL